MTLFFLHLKAQKYKAQKDQETCPNLKYLGAVMFSLWLIGVNAVLEIDPKHYIISLEGM